jgi:tRNA pseudouridine38-40 synthase
MKYFFEISYLGTAYSGWQRQKNASSIQENIETCISKLARQDITIHGCGRTDAGVHASQYFFHVIFDEQIDSADLLFKMNNALPRDIALHSIHKVTKHYNAQKDALKRRYDYYVHFESDPFTNQLSYLAHNKRLNISKCLAAMQSIVGKHDFTNFCKRPDSNSNCICNIMYAGTTVSENGKFWRFRFEGNRFLHNMIRLLMGNVLAIGEGRISLNDFNSYLNRSAKPQFHMLAQPHGLYLSKVEYEFLDLPERPVLFFR